jgi:hypothetical protein
VCVGGVESNRLNSSEQRNNSARLGCSAVVAQLSGEEAFEAVQASVRKPSSGGDLTPCHVKSVTEGLVRIIRWIICDGISSDSPWKAASSQSTGCKQISSRCPEA